MTDRRSFLGASDVAAALGLSPWRSPWQLWAEKTGRLEPAPANDAMAAGVALEPVVLEWAERQLGPLRRHMEFPISGTPIVAHPDGVTEAGEPVEAKTAGVLGPLYGDWGEPGTDQVPQHYLVQALVQLEATRGQVCYLPCLLGGRGVSMYVVARAEDLQAEIIERVCDWWRQHVIGDRPPTQDGMPPALQLLRRLKRQPQKIVEFGPEQVALVDAWTAAKEAAKRAAEEAERRQAAVLEALGDAEGATLSDGRVLTFLLQHRAGYVVQPTTFRVLRIRQRRE